MSEVVTDVRTLLGAKGFESSFLCLKSLVDYSADPLRLVVHEDGTLDNGLRDRLREINPTCTFVDRPCADDQMLHRLAKYPRCLKFRLREIMALKLFDIVLLSDGPVAYCDSDFLFLRRYMGLFRREDPAVPVFMMDVGHGYAVRPWKLWPFSAVRLAGHLCAGFTYAPAGFLDLEYLEWLIGKLEEDPVFERRRYWTEQTCWAGLAARSGAALLDPRRIVMATDKMNRYTPDAVAIHFVSTYRDRLAAYGECQRPLEEPPVTVDVVRTRRVGPVSLFATDMRRRVLGLR